jgi:ribosome-associated protein
MVLPVQVLFSEAENLRLKVNRITIKDNDLKIEGDSLMKIPLLAIEQEPVELYKILKMVNWVASGGEAKFMITEGKVFVNQVVETRKRKKIYSGDLIEFDGNKIRIDKPKS